MGSRTRAIWGSFSLTTSTGGQIKRKDEAGRPVIWDPKEAKPPSLLLPFSYLERETQARAIIDKIEILDRFRQELES